MWFLLALLSAFFSALSNVARRTHGSLAQPAELAWWSLLLSLPLGAGLLIVSEQPYWTSTSFVMPVLFAAILTTFSSILAFRAYKYGEASVVAPISNLLPIALVVTSFFMLGRLPAPAGMLGIILVVGGVYYSSVSGKHHLLQPFRQIWKNKGSRAMLGCILLWSVSTNFDKIALGYASPSLVLFFHQVVAFALISIYLLSRPQHKRIKHGEKVLKRWGWHLAAIATFTTLAVFFSYQAMNYVDPSYVISVKRLDVLLTVLFAGLFLREKHILKRFKGSAIALVGVVIIFVFG